jgi:cytochrome oxidase Cu insertion factor (SCO1/SenC/PrrC family)
MRLLIGSAHVLLATLLSLPGCGRSEKAPAPLDDLAADWGPPLGRPAPEIDGMDMEGTGFKLSDYRGKVVLLSFWAHF